MINAEKEIKSFLVLKNLYFESINFGRDNNMPSKSETDFDVEYKDLSEFEIEVKLKCIILGDTFKIEVVLVGVFENKEVDVNIRDQVNKINTVSIMFPYLRSELSLITAQPNFPTIDLPIMNINALLENKVKLKATINN